MNCRAVAALVQDVLPRDDRADARVLAVLKLAKFADGHYTPEIVEWLRHGLRTWLWHATRSGTAPSLLHYLGLPTTDKKVRQVLRDYWLGVAAQGVEGDTRASRARAMAQACRRFERQLWPCWRDLPIPPGNAPELDAALFYARRQGLALPESERRLWPIVAATGANVCKPSRSSWESSPFMIESDDRPPFRLFP